MNRNTITYTIDLVWQIKGYSHLKFGKDKRLYNCKTGRIKKQSYNGGSIGYWMDNKTFASLKKLRLLLEKIEFNECPF